MYREPISSITAWYCVDVGAKLREKPETRKNGETYYNNTWMHHGIGLVGQAKCTKTKKIHRSKVQYKYTGLGCMLLYALQKQRKL